MPTVLLTGASGFVGQRVWPALEAAGWEVRGLTRNPSRAVERWPARRWVAGDVHDEAACREAVHGCDAALYLVHGIGEGADFHRDEVTAAGAFARAAAAEGVRKIVYLGGVAPSDREHTSPHLASRLDVGATLRAGRVPTIELRASMIVGHGSLSWTIVRDLAARLPVMVLPRWLRSRTEPVAVDDVVVALVRALGIGGDDSQVFDLPGPEILSGRQILERVAWVLARPQPRMWEVPLLTPRLSSYWVHFVTRAEWSVAREIVVGLTQDLLAADAHFWDLIDHTDRVAFDEAARRALAEEAEGEAQVGAWGAVERALEHRHH